MEVNKTNESFLSSDGKNRIYYVVYRPVGAVKGVVQISHGMNEHIGRYDDFMMFLARNGFAVYGHDHLGHGASAKSKEDFGFFGEEDGWQFLVDDVYKVTKIVRREYPLQKIFLLGHSMGSFIARLYFMKYGNKIDGLILSGTSGGDSRINFGLAVADLWVRTKGKRYRSQTLQKMMFGSYNRKYDPARTQSDWISSDPGVVEDYLNDERNTFVFTAAGFKDLMTMLKMVSDERWAQNIPKGVPIFLFSGDMDPVGNYGKGVKKVYDALEDVGVRDVKIRIYAGGRHEMLNEINRLEVYEDVLGWINDHLAAGCR